jgi:hypothetical protein
VFFRVLNRGDDPKSYLAVSFAQSHSNPASGIVATFAKNRSVDGRSQMEPWAIEDGVVGGGGRHNNLEWSGAT